LSFFQEEAPVKALDAGPWWTTQETSESVCRRSFRLERLGGLLILSGLIALSYVAAVSAMSVLVTGGLLLAAGMTPLAAETVLGVIIPATRPTGGLAGLSFVLGIQLILAGASAITAGSAVRRLLALHDELQDGRLATRFQH
jgi:uncharacterized membrane protein HdeD (DUF308 family)